MQYVNAPLEKDQCKIETRMEKTIKAVIEKVKPGMDWKEVLLDWRNG